MNPAINPNIYKVSPQKIFVYEKGALLTFNKHELGYLVQWNLRSVSIIFWNIAGKKGFPCFKLDEASLKYCMGNHKARDHPKLSEESLQILRNHFTPILEKFKKQTGIELELSWLFKQDKGQKIFFCEVAQNFDWLSFLSKVTLVLPICNKT